MSVKSFIAAISLVLVFSSSAFAAEDASMHQVYLAAEAGKFSEAQAMMDQVLRDHPNSAKAHFVEAELLAKQGQISRAQAELNTAEKLQPGLAFAKPEAIQKLKAQLNTNSSFSPASSTGNGLPWGMIALIAGLIAFIYFVVKFMGNRNAVAAPANSYSNGPNGYAQPYNNMPMQNPAPTAGFGGGGIGSSIMGGLATGAAVGAGMVAGEALMHHFTDGGRDNNGLINNAEAANNVSNAGFNTQDDMGGTDFGISDNSSWDDSSGGGDDWT